jgi:hypothetical protein
MLTARLIARAIAQILRGKNYFSSIKRLHAFD